MSISVISDKLNEAVEIRKQIRTAAGMSDTDFPEDTPFSGYPEKVASVAAKVSEAEIIRQQIWVAASTKDVNFPEDTPFSEYPEKIASIPGHLQTKAIIPAADGGVVYPDAEYQGFSSVSIPAEPNLIPASIAAGKTIFGILGTAEAPAFNLSDLFEGTLTEVTSQSTIKLGPYLFYNNTVLQSVIFPALKTIGASAFYGCANLKNIDLSKIETVEDYGLNNCKAIVNIGTLKIQNIGNYGCYYLGYSVSPGFIYAPEEPGSVGDYGLQYAKITAVEGLIKKIGAYGLANLGSQFVKLRSVITGTIGNYGLANNQYLQEVDFSKSVIASIGTYAFYYLGWNRANYSTEWMELDFSNCKFNCVEQYSFCYIRYANIRLPASVTKIEAYAFQYDNFINVFMPDAAAPTLTATTCFSSASNYKIYAPFNHLNSYNTATTWSAMLAYMVGYAAAGKWAEGAELPLHNGEGFTLVWYSDEAKSTVITTVPAGSPMLYCDVGTKEKLSVSINISGAIVLTITDASGQVQDFSEGFILADSGTVLTVNATLPDGYVGNINIGNGKITEFPYSFTVENDMALKANGFDPNGTNPDFAEASWQAIKIAVDTGVAEAMYANQIGVEKEVALSSGQVLHVRLANATSDLYQYADGSGSTGLILEFVELWPTTYYMNPSSTNAGGWDASYMRNTVMPLLFNQLPEDLQDVIATVNTVSCKSGNDGTLQESADMLFIPAEHELYSTRSRSRPEEWNALQQWQYYVANNTNAARIKKRAGSAASWWLRGPCSGISTTFCAVSSSGSSGNGGAAYPYGVSPCFCI